MPMPQTSQRRSFLGLRMVNQLLSGTCFRQMAMIHQQQDIGNPLRLRQGMGRKDQCCLMSSAISHQFLLHLITSIEIHG